MVTPSNIPFNPDHPWSELLAGYVLGDLSSEDMIVVQQYLDQNPRAIAEIEELQTTLALLPLGLTEIAVPSDIRTAVFAAVDDRNTIASASPRIAQIPEKGQPDPLQKATTSQSSFRIPWSAITTGIAAAVAIGLGLQSHTLQQEMAATRQEIASLRQGQETIAQTDSRYRDAIALMGQTDSRTLTMVGTGAIAQASGQVMITPQQNRALLVVKNMPPPPSGKVYHLWAIVEGQKVGCIQFSPEADGQVMMQLPANRWTKAAQVVITIEPEQSEAQPTGEMVMSGQQL
jgi:anti-sigma-K factor RskA